MTEERSAMLSGILEPLTLEVDKYNVFRVGELAKDIVRESAETLFLYSNVRVESEAGQRLGDRLSCHDFAGVVILAAADEDLCLHEPLSSPVKRSAASVWSLRLECWRESIRT